MLARDIGDYGGVYVDAKPISNPQTQVSAAKLNRCLEDVAQMSRAAVRAELHFMPTSSPALTYHSSVWGDDVAQQPAITHVSTGIYDITYATSFTDALSVVETVSFFSGMCSVMSTSAYRANVASITSNVIRVRVWNSSSALSDATSSETIVLWLR